MRLLTRRVLPVLVGTVALIAAACGGDAGELDEGASANEEEAGGAALYEDGDVITLMVPYSAGGGFDLNARLIAPHLEDAILELAGAEVEVVVENVEGAAGQVAVEELYRSEPDGKTLSIMSTGAILPQAAFFDAQFDVSQMTYLAQVIADARGYIARTDLGFESFQDIIDRSQEEPILLGTAGISFAVDDVIMEALLADAGVEYQTQFVHFDGTGVAIGALLAGDIELYRVTITGGYSHVAENPDDLMWIATPAHERHELIPDVPTLAEEEIPEAETIADVAGYTRRIFAAPPGMDEELATFLREVFDTAIHSEAYQAEAEDQNLIINYLPGEELDELMPDAYEVFLSYSDEVNAWLAEEG